MRKEKARLYPMPEVRGEALVPEKIFGEPAALKRGHTCRRKICWWGSIAKKAKVIGGFSKYVHTILE